MATWTSVSLFSTSAWNGPTGCAIISPSRWNPMVASNLEVLSYHNHSGSAGEGQILSTNALIASPIPTLDSDAFSPFFPTASTNWIIANRANWVMMGIASTCTQGATISYDVYPRKGTYQLTIICSTGTSNAIITACINNVFAASLDTYRPGGPPNACNATCSMSFSLTGAGSRILTFAADTKNGNSEGYTIELAQIALMRMGD